LGEPVNEPGPGIVSDSGERSARLQRLTNLMDLYRALGGGWIELAGDHPRPADAPLAGLPGVGAEVWQVDVSRASVLVGGA